MTPVATMITCNVVRPVVATGAGIGASWFCG
jgi:hypothetical protein